MPQADEPEPVTQSEVSQKEKNKYIYQCIYMESRKMVLMIDFQGRTGDADVENGLVDTAGEGAGGMNGEQQY